MAASLPSAAARPRPLFTGIPSSGHTQLLIGSPANDGQRFRVASAWSADQLRRTLVGNWPSALAAPRADPKMTATTQPSQLRNQVRRQR